MSQSDVANDELTARETYETFQKAWGIFAPVVMLIYIIPVFLINLILWFFLILIAIPRQLLRVRFIPLFLLAASFGLLLIQANQDSIVKVADIATACVDQIYAFFGKAIFDDFIISVYPICTILSYVMSVVKYTIRSLTNEYRCYFTCDIDACECTTCGGGAQCTCDECGLPSCNGACDTSAVGCPTAGGFSVFLGDCCLCFIVAFRQILLSAGVPLPEALQIVQDLIDYLDIVPSTDPNLFENFVANFPQPGEVDWLYSQTLRKVYHAEGKQFIPFIEKNSIEYTQVHLVKSYSMRSYGMLMDRDPDKGVLLERYINMSSEGYSREQIVKEIPDPILNVLCAGKDPGIDCPSPDPLTGYNYPIFELVANQFFGPFIETFLEGVLWLFNFISVFFEQGLDIFLGELEDVINGTFGPTEALNMVVNAFRRFTQTFLCTLVGWALPGPYQPCCESLDFTDPVDFFFSIFQNGNCFGSTIDLSCLASIDALASCIASVGDGISVDDIDPTFQRTNKEYEDEYNTEYKVVTQNKRKSPNSGIGQDRGEIMKQIEENPILNFIHKHFMRYHSSKTREEASEELLRSEEAFRDLFAKSNKPSEWEQRMNVYFMDMEHQRSFFDKIANKLDTYKQLRKIGKHTVSKSIDFFGSVVYDYVEAYVSKVGVGQSSSFAKNTLDIKTIRAAKRHLRNSRSSDHRSSFDIQQHIDFLDDQERLWHQHMTKSEKDLTHGQKALRYTSHWVGQVKKMLFFPIWVDDSYQFITPSHKDLETEMDSRAIGSSIYYSFKHTIEFVKQDNKRYYSEVARRAERTSPDQEGPHFGMEYRPSFIIELEVSLKSGLYTYMAPNALETLREELCERGPRWCQASHRVIDPKIRSREVDLRAKNERLKALRQGDVSKGYFQLSDISFAKLCVWVLQSASYRANSVAHRKAITKAVYEGNLTKYVNLKLTDKLLKNPGSIITRDKNIESKYKKMYQRQFGRLKKSIDGKQRLPTLDDEEGPNGVQIDPELVEFWKNHNTRLNTAKTPEEHMMVYRETAERLPQLLVVGKLLLPLLKNYPLVISAATVVLSSPYAQNIYGFYLEFLREKLGDIINEPIKDIVDSPGYLLDFAQDFSVTTLNSLSYLATELERTLLCLTPQIVLQTTLQLLGQFISLIPYVGSFFSIIVSFFNTAGTFFLPIVAVCPAEVIVGEQNPINYLFDVLDCDPDIECMTRDDCPGKAPCRKPIPRITQWLSLFWKFDPDVTCPPGQICNCVCWFQGPCDQAAPEFQLNEFFEEDCNKFGYKADESLVPWYPGNPDIFGSFSNFLDYLQLYLESGFVWMQFISKTIARGWEPFFSITTFVAIAGVSIGFAIALGRLLLVFALFVLLVSIAYGGPVYTDFVSDTLIPAIQRVQDGFGGFIGDAAEFTLKFFQFDNADEFDRIGSPDPNEFTCFLLNSGTGLFAVSAASILILLLLLFLSLGILYDIIQFFIYMILILPRTLWRLLEFTVFVVKDDQNDYEGSYEGGYEGDYEDYYTRNYSKYGRHLQMISDTVDDPDRNQWYHFRIGAPLRRSEYTRRWLPEGMHRGIGPEELSVLAHRRGYHRVGTMISNARMYSIPSRARIRGKN